MAWLRGYQFRRTTLLTVFYVSFLAGVALAARGHTVALAWLSVLVVWFCVGFRRTAVGLLLIIIFGVSIGLWRGAAYGSLLAGYNPLYGQKTSLFVRASDDGVYGKKSQITFDADHVRTENGSPLAGKVMVSGFGVNSVYQGDEVQVEAKLYPGFGAYQGRMSYARLSLLRHHASAIASVRRKFAAGMQSALPEPLASFAMGLLIGQRATLPDNVKQDLLMVGLTHIIAVSGYNLTIILRAIGGVFGGQSKRIAALFNFLLIGLFVLLAGSSASITRAAIVSMLSIVAGYYGRSFKPLNLIALAAAITVWLDPVYIWSDASWYLSFLAFCGIMILEPLLEKRLWPGRQLPLIFAVALESVCAEVMTLPYVLHTFGQMSFIGLPANVLVVTLVPLAMLLSAIAGLAGMIIAPFAGWVAWPARSLLSYMLDVAHLLSHIPHIFVQNINFTTAETVLTYASIVAFIAALSFKTSLKNGTITEEITDQPSHLDAMQGKSEQRNESYLPYAE